MSGQGLRAALGSGCNAHRVCTKSSNGVYQVKNSGRLPDGKLLYLEEVRSGRHHLATKSLRLQSATARADDIIASLGLDARSDSIEAEVLLGVREFNIVKSV